MPSTAGIVASGSAQLDQWLRANLIAFDERRSSPLTNLGTLGAAGNATATGTRRLVNTGTKAFVWLPGVASNFLSVADPAELAGATELDVSVALLDEDWSPGSNQILVCQSTNGGAANTSFQFYLTSTGFLGFTTSDGAAVTTVFSSAAVPLADGTAGCLRFKWRASDGRVQFLTKSSTADAALADAALTTGWSQLGTDQTGRTTPLANVSSVLSVGAYAGGTLPLSATVYGGHFATTIDGAPFLTIDPSVLTDEGATSFTATTGQTVTINRGTGAAYKTATVLPGSAKRLFNGTSSDFLAMADVADIGAGDSCSVWALVRQWATPVSNGRYWSKWDGSSGAGWHLSSNGTALTVNGYVDDGPDSATATSAAMTGGGLSLIGFTLDRGTNLLTPYLNGTAGTAVSASSIGDLTNTEILYYGRNAANNANQAHESPLRGIYPGALTAAQWAALRDALLVPERAAA